jgi:ATP-dependent protease ClpP protease subunit
MEQTILIHGEIGWEVTASAVNAQIDEAIANGVEKITFDIETFGGDVFTGRSILGRIDKAKTAGIIIETNVYSYAYSMGAVLFESATAGYRKIGEFGEIMLHAALSGVMGNAEDMRKAAEQLDEVTNNLKVVIFRNENAKANETEILELMSKESLINSTDAMRLGLADGFIEKAKAVAYYKQNQITNMSIFKPILDKLDAIASKFKNEGEPAPIVNAVIETKEGGKLYHSGEVAVGTAVFSDEAMATPAADGIYTTDANVIEVAAGLIAVITDVQADNVAALKDENINLANELAVLKAEKEQLNAAKLAAENKVGEIEKEFNEVKNMVVTMAKPERSNAPENTADLPKWKADMINRKKYELS